MIRVLWGILYLIRIFQTDFCLEGYSINFYSNWLIIISVIILYIIFLFRADSLVVFLMNVLGINILLFFFSRRVFIFYILFEFGLIPMMILILTRGYQPERMGARLWFLLYTIFGSLPLLFFLIYIYNNNGRSFIFIIRPINRNLFIFPLVVAFLVKLPVYGFHPWLPKAHVQAPVTGRIFLAAIMLKIGGFGIFFLKPLLITGNRLRIVVILASVVGSVIAILYCIILDDLKMVIAYRRIGHIGLVVGTILRDNEIGVWRRLLIIVGHGYTSSLMFYLGNDLYLSQGSRSLSIVKGIVRRRSILIIFIRIVLILNISFPPSINIFGEISAVISIVPLFPSRIIVLILLVLLGGIFNIKLYVNVRHGTNSIGYPSFKIRRKSITVGIRHFLPYLLLAFFFYAKTTIYKNLHTYCRVTYTYKHFNFLKLWKNSRGNPRNSNPFRIFLENTLYCRHR